MRILSDIIYHVCIQVDAKSGVCAAIIMAQDPIANYVIKKAIESAPEGDQKQNLLQELRRNRDELVIFLTERTRIWFDVFCMSKLLSLFFFTAKVTICEIHSKQGLVLMMLNIRVSQRCR